MKGRKGAGDSTGNRKAGLYRPPGCCGSPPRSRTKKPVSGPGSGAAVTPEPPVNCTAHGCPAGETRFSQVWAAHESPGVPSPPTPGGRGSGPAPAPQGAAGRCAWIRGPRLPGRLRHRRCRSTEARPLGLPAVTTSLLKTRAPTEQAVGEPPPLGPAERAAWASSAPGQDLPSARPGAPRSRRAGPPAWRPPRHPRPRPQTAPPGGRALRPP